MLNLFRLELINSLTLDNPFGISINISLNSLINGGNTMIETTYSPERLKRIIDNNGWDNIKSDLGFED